MANIRKIVIPTSTLQTANCRSLNSDEPHPSGDFRFYPREYNRFILGNLLHYSANSCNPLSRPSNRPSASQRLRLLSPAPAETADIPLAQPGACSASDWLQKGGGREVCPYITPAPSSTGLWEGRCDWDERNTRNDLCRPGRSSPGAYVSAHRPGGLRPHSASEAIR